jgi:hypothetical protein
VPVPVVPDPVPVVPVVPVPVPVVPVVPVPVTPVPVTPVPVTPVPELIALVITLGLTPVANEILFKVLAALAPLLIKSAVNEMAKLIASKSLLAEPGAFG